VGVEKDDLPGFGGSRVGSPRSNLTQMRSLQSADRKLSCYNARPDPHSYTYGRIKETLRAKGQIIGENDLWIAAHALAEDYILVTNNTREFKRIKGLKIENWAA
jgi:tRNA(fMet)-specific endonuclease VapC